MIHCQVDMCMTWFPWVEPWWSVTGGGTLQWVFFKVTFQLCQCFLRMVTYSFFASSIRLLMHVSRISLEASPLSMKYSRVLHNPGNPISPHLIADDRILFCFAYSLQMPLSILSNCHEPHRVVSHVTPVTLLWHILDPYWVTLWKSQEWLPPNMYIIPTLRKLTFLS